MTFKEIYGDLSDTIYEGDFYCWSNKLTSLEGSPKEVHGDFSCYNNNLTSLKGSPEIVYGHFNCSGNNLTSLEECPEIVHGDFECSANRLKNLDYLPEILIDNLYSEFDEDFILEEYKRLHYEHLAI